MLPDKRIRNAYDGDGGKSDLLPESTLVIVVALL